jgi:hypothetical protein
MFFAFTDILAAESLQYTDPTLARSTDALYTLRDVLVEKKEHAWLTCVDNALANSFLKQKEWRLACAALDNLKTSIPACVRALIQSDSSLVREKLFYWTCVDRVTMYSYTFLQCIVSSSLLF